MVSNGGVCGHEEVKDGERLFSSLTHFSSFSSSLPLSSFSLTLRLSAPLCLHTPSLSPIPHSLTFPSSLSLSLSLSPLPLPPPSPPAMNQWAALCKALPGTTDGLSLWTKCKADFEGVKVKPTSMPHVRVVNPVTWEEVKPVNIETTPTLFALALGCGKRDDAETLYQDMLEYARHKGKYMYMYIL